MSDGDVGHWRGRSFLPCDLSQFTCTSRWHGEWHLLHALCADKRLAANDIRDAWLAAAVSHQGEHLVTFDGDFKRLLSRSQFTRLST